MVYTFHGSTIFQSGICLRSIYTICYTNTEESGAKGFCYSRLLKLSKVTTDPFDGALDNSTCWVSPTAVVLVLSRDFLPVPLRQMLL